MRIHTSCDSVASILTIRLPMLPEVIMEEIGGSIPGRVKPMTYQIDICRYLGQGLVITGYWAMVLVIGSPRVYSIMALG